MLSLSFFFYSFLVEDAVNATEVEKESLWQSWIFLLFIGQMIKQMKPHKNGAFMFLELH